MVGPCCWWGESAPAWTCFLTIWPHGPRSDSTWMLESPRAAIGQTKRKGATKALGRVNRSAVSASGGVYGPPERSRYGASIMSRIQFSLEASSRSRKGLALENWGVCRGSGLGEGVPGGFRFAPGWPSTVARRRTIRRGSRRVIGPGGRPRLPVRSGCPRSWLRA